MRIHFLLLSSFVIISTASAQNVPLVPPIGVEAAPLVPVVVPTPPAESWLPRPIVPVPNTPSIPATPAPIAPIVGPPVVVVPAPPPDSVSGPEIAVPCATVGGTCGGNGDCCSGSCAHRTCQ